MSYNNLTNIKPMTYTVKIVETKCPETKLEVKKMNELITINLTLKELQQIDKYVEVNDDTLSVLMKIKDAYPPQKSPVEEAYKDWWGQYPQLETDSEYDEMRWQGFQAGFHFAYEEKAKEDDYNDKSQPRMNFLFDGKFEIVSYNDKEYLRLEFTDESHGWYKRKHTVDGVVMVSITDGETHRLLEGVWFNDVKKGKYD